jgi:DNA-binding LacI/PurR family transcriptional regulator
MSPAVPAVSDPPRLVGMILTGSAAQVGVEPFFMELVGGLEQALAPTGTSVLLLVVEDLAAELATYRRWAAEGTVSAVVVVNLVQDDGRPAELATVSLPAVLAGRYAGPEAFTSVVTDDSGAMTAAMRLLHSLGHRIIGRVSGPAELVHTAERSTAMRESGRRLAVDVRIVEADYSAQFGVAGARQLLATAKPPSAIIFDNDVMAVAAEADLVRAGVRVPGQVSLLACDDSALCELAVPPLSTMSIDVHEHGVTIGRAVIEVLDGLPRREHLGPTIRILSRGSTGPAPDGAGRFENLAPAVPGRPSA